MSIIKVAKRGGFFVSLCYGYVGRYKDTSKMTTKEVIEEFLKRKGVSSPREFFNKVFVKNERQHKHLNKWTEPPSFGEQEVIFISKNGTNKGASIRQLVHWEEKGEILVSSKAEYKVVNKYTKGKRTYIEVEEI